jgi:predicted amidohydrolase
VVVFANRVGFEEGVNFWGGSEVIGPDGKEIAAAPLFDESLLLAQIHRADLRRERIGSPLGRDEKLLLTLQELDRIRRARFTD